MKWEQWPFFAEKNWYLQRPQFAINLVLKVFICNEINTGFTKIDIQCNWHMTCDQIYQNQNNLYCKCWKMYYAEITVSQNKMISKESKFTPR